MPTPRFIQIHALQNYTGTLLNRDDSGLAKTMPYGGVLRTRISSQCLKRHWRKADGEFSLSSVVPDPVRTKELVDMSIMKGVRERIPGLDESVVQNAVDELNKNLYGNKGHDKNSRQVLLFGQPEIEFLVDRVSGILSEYHSEEDVVKHVKQMFGKGEKRNFEAFRQSQAMPAGLVGAMYGRMVASDAGANIEAAVHVAHAFTVSSEEKEIDYFTAMEDLSLEPGAGHIGTTEINSGIYYVYVVVDIPGLIANTTGSSPEDWFDQDREIASEAVSRLVGLIATVSPGAKKGSTAPYGYAKSMLVEVGERQPRSLAGAYRTPANPSFDSAVQRLEEEVETYDSLYGSHEARKWLGSMNGNSGSTLNDVIRWVRDVVKDGVA